MSQADVPSPAPRPPSRRGLDPVALSWVSSALLFALLVLANAAFARTTVRVDLTEEQIYSLSSASKKVLRDLSDVATIKVYWDKEIPSNAAIAQRRLRGLLEEYEANGDGRVRVEWVDMATDAGKKEAEDLGVFKGGFQEIGAAKVQLTQAYHGIVLLYEDKTATLGPLVEASQDNTYQAASGLEYDLTSALWKWSRKATPVVGVVKSASTPDFMAQMHGRGGGDKFTLLTGPKLLGKEYGEALKTSVDLDLAVPPEITVLLVLAPQELSEKKAFHLEQFVLRGGKAFVLVDRVGIEQASQGTPAKKTGLEDWWKSLGIEVPDAVVGDYHPSAMGRVVLRDPRGDALMMYPYFPQLRLPFLEQRVPGTRGIDGIALYWPNEVRIDEAVQKEAGRKTTVLATTSNAGYLRSSLYGLLDLDSLEDPQAKDLAKRTVMAMVEGPFTSYWKGKPSPADPPPTPKKDDEKKDGEPAGTPPEPGMDAEPAMAPEPGMDAEPAMTPEPGMDAEPAMTPEPGMDAEPAMDGPVPPAEPPPAPEKDEKGARGPEGPEGETAEAKPARLDSGNGVLVILGDAGLVSDEFGGGFLARWNGQAGFTLVPNVVEWLTGSEDLLALRTRGVKSRKLDEVGEEKANQIRWTNFLAAPALLAMVGLVIFFVRRHRS
jgi:ABC-type uncharacterized transport system involved in gliding motility auxiliary subunit